jgi:RND superfamily putative drug exporter
MLKRLADLAYRRPWHLVAVAGAFAAVAGGLGGSVVASLSPAGFTDPGSQTAAAERRFEAAAGYLDDGGLLAMVKIPEGPASPAAQARVGTVADRLSADPGVRQVLSYYTTRNPGLVSSDGRSTMVVALLRTDVSGTSARLEKAFKGDRDVVLGGAAVASNQIGSQVQEDLARAELFAFPILFLLSLWVFRSAVAALLPLMVGGVTILGTFLALRLVNNVLPLSVFSINLVTGLGLGLAIDYSLFLVTRFREEMARGAGVARALETTLATSGRTVAFSSLTVAAALASLLVFPQRFLYSMAVGGVLVALMALASSLLLLPAVLRLLGPRVNSLAPSRWRRLAESGQGSPFWYAVSARVMRAPLLFAAVGAGLLLLLALPATGIKFTSVDASVLPTSASAREVNDATQSGFPGLRQAAAQVVVAAPSSDADAVAAYAARIAELSGVESVSKPQPLDGKTWAFNVISKNPVFSTDSQDMVRRVRSEPAPYQHWVGGSSAGFVDLEDSLVRHLPLVIAILGGATLVLLFLMTGSLLLPLKAFVMNLLTLSAAFGLLVFVFQDGRFQSLLRYSPQGALEATQPVLLFAIVFGLSTDYGVFLLSRIKEARDSGRPNREAVADGLSRTGRVVTAAALLFCVAVGAFASSQIVFIKELGLGIAAGVILDASIVRAFLVPSLMALLGAWNWWAPAPLRRLHDRVGLREAGRVVPA